MPRARGTTDADGRPPPLPQAIQRYQQAKETVDRLRAELADLNKQIVEWAQAHGRLEGNGKRLRAQRRVAGYACIVVLNIADCWTCDAALLLREVPLRKCLQVHALKVANAAAAELVPLETIGKNDPVARLLSCEAVPARARESRA